MKKNLFCAMMLSFNIAWAGYPYYFFHISIQNLTDKTVVIKELVVRSHNWDVEMWLDTPIFKGVTLKPMEKKDTFVNQRRLIFGGAHGVNADYWWLREILIDGKLYKNEQWVPCGLWGWDYRQSYIMHKPAAQIEIKDRAPGFPKADYGYEIHPLVTSYCAGEKMGFEAE
jgi:hypothetical protein